MSALEPLAPDQRAVLALILQQRRSYGEIAGLLGMPAEAVRGRAHAGLVALEPRDGLTDELAGRLADYLLGQQAPADADATRGLLSESAPARAWANGVAGRLGGVSAVALPEIPAGEASAAATPPPGSDPEPAREPGAAADASRLGGALLIAGVLAVVLVVLFLALSGDGNDGEEPAASGGSSSAPGATPTPTPTPAATALRAADTIPLRAAGGGAAEGTMTVYLQGEDQLLFELLAENVPPTGDRAAYAVWLTGPGARARRLGFTDPVGQDGELGIQGPSQKDLARFPRLFATYESVVVSQESTEAATRPSNVILSGRLPRGR